MSDQRCDVSFIDEWTHRWDFHPDSSNHRWVSRPGPIKPLETSWQTMTLAESPDLRHHDVHVKDTEEDKDEEILDPAIKKQNESSDPLHMNEPEQIS